MRGQADDGPGLELPAEVARLRWESPTPVTDLLNLTRSLAARRDQLEFGERVVFAELVVDLRVREHVMTAAAGLADHVDNEWVRHLLASLMLVAGRTVEVDALVRGELGQLAALDPSLQRRWLHLAARRGPALLRPVSSELAGSAALDGAIVELDLGEPLPERRVEELVEQLSEQPRMDVTRARTCVDVLASRMIDGARFRSQCVPWSVFDTFDRELVTAVVDDALAAADAGRGFSMVRLGDGEAQVLAGVMPDITGVLGIDPDGEWIELDDEEYARLRERIRAALRGADVVGVPDLAQCLGGPVGYAEVTSLCLEAGVESSRILPGGSDLGWAMEISGEVDRLLARCSGVIGPISPRDLRRIPDGVDPVWLPVPGELLYYHDEWDPTVTHWSLFESIVAHEYRPGEVWLVGAGVLGKVYCEAIRRAGAVAVDLGSVFDIWSGRQDTRGTVREQPWVAVPYADGGR